MLTDARTRPQHRATHPRTPAFPARPTPPARPARRAAARCAAALGFLALLWLGIGTAVLMVDSPLCDQTAVVVGAVATATVVTVQLSDPSRP